MQPSSTDGPEIEAKLARLRAMMEREGIGAVYLKHAANFAWITAGRLNQVGTNSDLGVAGILITAHDRHLITNVVEAPRLMEEEGLGAQGCQLHEYPWDDDREHALVGAIAGGVPAAADHPFPGARDVAALVAPLRYTLTPAEVQRYVALGRAASLAVEAEAATVRPGDRESVVAGRLLARLWADRIDHAVILVAADDRIARFRHPVVTERAVKERMMLAVCARRGGLVVSLSRFVQFAPVGAEQRRRHEAVTRIASTMAAATRVGDRAAVALERGLALYTELGFADQPRLHHQGGAIGYAAREYKVTPNTVAIVQENQGFAWNPTVTGAKCEDTFIATSAGPLFVTAAQQYPAVSHTVDGRTFNWPDILVG